MASDARSSGRAFAALVGGAMFIGTAPIFTKLAMTHGHIGPGAAALWRVTLATPMFLVVWCLQGREAGDRPPIRRGLLLLPGVIFAADLVCWHSALQHTSAALATLLGNCAVVIVSLVGWLWLGERLDRRFILGVTVAFVGVVTLLGNDALHDRQSFLGNLLGLATAGFYASYLLTIKTLRRACSTVRLMMWATVVAALSLAVWVWLTESERWVPDTAAGWWALVGLALVAHVAGQGLITYGLAHLPASFSAVTLLIQPVAAAALGWVILHEQLNGLRLGGAGLVLLGIMTAQRGVGGRLAAPRSAEV